MDPTGRYPAELAGVALAEAARAGAGYAEFRAQRGERLEEAVRDGQLTGSHRRTEAGYGIRVLLDGTWGFAAGTGPGRLEVAATARLACELARATRPLRGAPTQLAAEPAHDRVSWTSSYRIDPFEVPGAERVARFAEWSDRLLGAGIDHVDARLLAVRERTWYANSEGADIRQAKVWLHPMLVAVRVDRGAGRFETMRTLAPPVARGWEYLDGAGWDWDAELAGLPEQLAAKAAAPGVRAGPYDLVIDPTNLWLTIHETVGHATELDRVLGHEAAFAGTSFATLDRLGRLRYGSPAMNVVADRTTEHGLATVGYDDEGVAAQRWDLIRAGVLVGYQIDRQSAGRVGLARSNGCAYADSFTRAPIVRMANVSLRP